MMDTDDMTRIKKVRNDDKKSILYFVLAGFISIVFSFVTFMGKYYEGNLDIWIKGGSGKSVWIAVWLIGGFAFFLCGFLGIGAFRKWLRNRNEQSTSIICRIEKSLFGKHCFLKQSIIITLFWMPHIFIRYPGALGLDAWNVIAQYYGQQSFTTQHPIIYTLVIGKMIDFGSFLGNVNYGLFLLICLQTIATIFAFAYMISILKKIGVPFRFCSFTLGFIIFIPVIIAFATTVIVDTPYCAAFVLLMTELACYLYLPDEYKKSWRHRILTVMAVLGTFFRYNGIYVVAMTLCCIIVREIYLLWKKQQLFRYTCFIIALFFIPLFLGKSCEKYLNESYESKQISKRAMFAIPIQQIGNYMVYYGDDVTDEQWKNLKKVMKWDREQYQQRYNPLNFDGLKRGFNNNASMKDILCFLKVWVQLFMKHPDSYVNAFINQNYFLFSPLAENVKYYRDAYSLEVSSKANFKGLFSVTEERKIWQKKIVNYYYQFTHIPLAGLLVNQGVYSFLLLGIGIYGLCEKKEKIIILMIPMLVTFLIALVAPAAYGNARYTYPIMYSMPLLMGIFCIDGVNYNRKRGQKSNE